MSIPTRPLPSRPTLDDIVKISPFSERTLHRHRLLRKDERWSDGTLPLSVVIGWHLPEHTTEWAVTAALYLNYNGQPAFVPPRELRRVANISKNTCPNLPWPAVRLAAGGTRYYLYMSIVQWLEPIAKTAGICPHDLYQMLAKGERKLVSAGQAVEYGQAWQPEVWRNADERNFPHVKLPTLSDPRPHHRFLLPKDA